MRLGPILDDLDFVGSHEQAFRRQDVTKVLNLLLVKLALFRLGVKPMLPKASEHFFNLSGVSSFIGRVNENVVQVDNHADI